MAQHRSAGWLLAMHIAAACASSCMMLMFLYAQSPGARATLAGACIAVALGCAAWFVIKQDDQELRMPFMLLACSSVLILMLMGWNVLYLRYCDSIPLPMRKEAFRTKLYRWYTPVYGKPDFIHGIALWLLIGCGVVVGGVYSILWRYRPSPRWTLPVILMCQTLAILAIGYSDGTERLTGVNSGYEMFARDIPKFDGSTGVLRNYVDSMSKLSWFGRHYPPGNLLLMKWTMRLEAPWLAKVLVIISSLAATVLVWKHAHLMSRNLKNAGVAAMLVSLSFACIVFCTLNTTTLLLVPTIVAAMALLLDIVRPHWKWRAVLALSMVAYTWFSFSVAFLAVCLGLILLQCVRHRVITAKHAVRLALQSLVFFALTYTIIWAATGYNIASCFANAIANHHKQQAGSGFDGPTRYLLRSTGNILAYAYTSLPLIAATLLVIWKGRKSVWSHVYAAPLLISILLAGFSGLFFFETERIWMFFTPLLAVAAVIRLPQDRSSSGHSRFFSVILISLFISFASEMYFTFWRP